jgi:O-antigen/teichoic acid export membrane protein
MVGPGLFFLLIPVANYLTNQFTLLVVQKALDASEVSRLATHRMAVNLAVMAGGFLVNAFWPELTALHARGGGERLIQVQRSLTKLNVWLVGGLTFGVLPFLPWIYTSWTAGRLTLDQWTLAFLIMRTLIWAGWNTGMIVLLATNQHQLVSVAVLGAAAVTVGLAVPLVPVMGISGAALAILLGDVCVTGWVVPLLASRRTGDNYRRFVTESGSALVGGVGIPVVFGLFAWQFLTSPIIRYGIVIPFGMGLALILMWRQLNSAERQVAIGLYRHALTKGNRVVLGLSPSRLFQRGGGAR